MAVKSIYLAGGCFWGVEGYFSKISGIISTKAGYANGNLENPTYEQVCEGDTNCAEAIYIEYDDKTISLESVINHFLDIIDPTALNRQGNDVGTQYRSGIYYTDEKDRLLIQRILNNTQKKYAIPIAVELGEIKSFYPAEEYHQKYLDKNPFGYCHIDMSKIKKYLKYKKPDEDEIKEKLSSEEFEITQKSATEAPYSSQYDNFFEEGIYVDIVTGEPLFSSTDKFNSGCGWPAFSKPIEKSNIIEKDDDSYGMIRTEVRSDIGNSHLGHLFDDGPKETGGQRYCINGAALKFIPLKNMEKEGYADYLYLFKKKDTPI